MIFVLNVWLIFMKLKTRRGGLFFENIFKRRKIHKIMFYIRATLYYYYPNSNLSF